MNASYCGISHPYATDFQSVQQHLPNESFYLSCKKIQQSAKSSALCIRIQLSIILQGLENFNV